MCGYEDVTAGLAGLAGVMLGADGALADPVLSAGAGGTGAGLDETGGVLDGTGVTVGGVTTDGGVVDGATDGGLGGSL